MVSEGLAQYGAVLTIESLDGEKAATEFLRFSGGSAPSLHCARGFFWLQRRGRDRPLTAATGGPESVGHTLANSKGVWVYHMLRRRVGDELFFGTLQALVDRYGGGSMSLRDLRRAFAEAAPPEARLETFFAQWLDRTGAPRLDLEWSDVWQEENHLARVVVTQRAKPYDLDLDIAVDTENGTELHTVRLSQAEQTYMLSVPGKPTRVRLDPEHRLLIWKPEYSSWGFLFHRFGRLLVWEIGCIFLLGVLGGCAQARALELGLLGRHSSLPVVPELLIGMAAGASACWLGWWGIAVAVVASAALYLARRTSITDAWP